MSTTPIGDLRAIVGEEHVLVDDDVRRGYEVDWTGRWGGPATAVVRPASTAEVAEVVGWCDERDVSVVPQGGNTGLVGGSVPAGDAGPTVVLSLRRLSELGPVDRSAQQVTVGAGVTLAAWRDHARAAGLDAPVDFAARDTATVGGAIATNAGGSRVLRFGTMRSQVSGVEAVLADGTTVGSLGGLPKETAGLHWPSLLAGSEGTLAVVTRARLRLAPRYPHVVTAMVGTPSVGAAVRLLGVLRESLGSLDSVEVLLPAALDLVASHLGADPPVAGAATLLIECADHTDPTDALLGRLESSPDVAATAVATDAHRRDGLVRYRDRMTEAIAAAAADRGDTAFKLDVAVPVDSLATLVATAERAAAEDGALLIPFGHLAEGNLHLNHLGVTDPERLTTTVLSAVAELGGTISAEHGIGVAKSRWLPLIRSVDELAAQRRIRAALDPKHTLNPHVLNAPAGG